MEVDKRRFKIMYMVEGYIDVLNNNDEAAKMIAFVAAHDCADRFSPYVDLLWPIIEVDSIVPVIYDENIREVNPT